LPIPVVEQIAVLLAVTQGLFDDLPLEDIAGAEKTVRQTILEHLPEVVARIEDGEKLTPEDRQALLSVMREGLSRKSNQSLANITNYP
jgi:F-type H+-transporting ATPase subunit alpha